MVYIVQQNDYQYRDVIGVFESEQDALMKASEEEAINQIACDVYSLPVISPSDENAIDDKPLTFRYKEEELSERAKEAIARRRQQEETVRDLYKETYREATKTNFKLYMANTPNRHQAKTLIKILADENYRDLKTKLVNGSITLEEYKNRQETIKLLAKDISKDIHKVWKDTNVFSLTYALDHLQKLTSNFGFVTSI